MLGTPRNQSAQVRRQQSDGAQPRKSPGTGNRSDLRFSQLSSPRQALLRCIQQIGFGRIHNLLLEVGQPKSHSCTRVVRTMKVGSLKEGLLRDPSNDFALSSQWVHLFEEFDRLGNARLSAIEVRNGLPAILEVEEPMNL